MYLLKYNHTYIYKHITNKTILQVPLVGMFLFIYLNLRQVAQVNYNIVKKYIGIYDISTIIYYECDKY